MGFSYLRLFNTKEDSDLNAKNYSDVDPLAAWNGLKGELGLVINYHLFKRIGIVSGLEFGKRYFFKGKGVKLLASKTFDRSEYYISEDMSNLPSSWRESDLENSLRWNAYSYNRMIDSGYVLGYFPVDKQKLMYYVISMPFLVRIGIGDKIWFDLGTKLNYLLNGTSMYLASQEAKDPFKATNAFLVDMMAGVGGTLYLMGAFVDIGFHVTYGLNSFDVDYHVKGTDLSAGLVLNFWLF